MNRNHLFFAFISFCLATPAFASGVAPGLYINANGSPLVPLIHSATGSIDIEIYTMYDLNVRNAIRDEIAKKISIRVIQ